VRSLYPIAAFTCPGPNFRLTQRYWVFTDQSVAPYVAIKEILCIMGLQGVKLSSQMHFVPCAEPCPRIPVFEVSPFVQPTGGLSIPQYVHLSSVQIFFSVLYDVNTLVADGGVAPYKAK